MRWFFVGAGTSPGAQVAESLGNYRWAVRLGVSLGCKVEGPCTQIVYTLAPKCLYRDYLKAKVYTIWVHGPLGKGFRRF